MTSERRVASNRRNATKSTGPKTEEGRRRVSQNARRHGLTQATKPESMMRFLSILLEDQRLRGRRLSTDCYALAVSLADAEARLERVRNAEFRFLEDCHALGREEMHLERHWELLTTAHSSPEAIDYHERRTKIDSTRDSEPQVIKRSEKVDRRSYDRELRRLLRYRKEAENLRHKALQSFIGVLQSGKLQGLSQSCGAGPRESC